MHYVIGDVHGCYDEMLDILSKIESQDDDARFIFVGDFVDRGPKVWECIEWMMSHITRDGKYRSVQGNHEQMILQWYMEYCEWEKKTIHLTPAPRTNYDFMDVAKAHGMLSSQKLAPIMNFFMNMPFHIVHRVTGKHGVPITYDIVHAWYDYDEPEDSGQQYLDNLWRREVDGNHESSHIIIHGHTPTLAAHYVGKEHTAPGMIIYRKNAINIDGGCVFARTVKDAAGYLCGLCLETLEEFYSPEPTEKLSAREYKLYFSHYRNSPDPYREQILSRLR